MKGARRMELYGMDLNANGWKVEEVDEIRLKNVNNEKKEIEVKNMKKTHGLSLQGN